MKRLSFDPLGEYVSGKHGSVQQMLLGMGLSSKDSEYRTAERIFLRSRERGWVGEPWADRFCVKFLGLDPCLIWGKEWWALDKDEEVVAC